MPSRNRVSPPWRKKQGVFFRRGGLRFKIPLPSSVDAGFGEDCAVSGAGAKGSVVAAGAPPVALAGFGGQGEVPGRGDIALPSCLAGVDFAAMGTGSWGGAESVSALNHHGALSPSAH